MPEPPPVWSLRSISKRFPGVLANDRVSLDLHAGEIHGLMGENGCGKSTLIKTLSGAHQPDSGEILKDGTPIVLADPIAARRAGISTVFQEFSLVPSLSVAENIHLGRLPRRGRRVDWPAMRTNATALLADMAIDIDPDRPVDSLSVAEQQLVEIAKALSTDASLLILDEPTTALGLEEIARLHGLLRRLKVRGTAVLYISHRLDEVVDLVDCVTILKEGRVVSTSAQSRVEIAYIVDKMVGDVGDYFPKVRNATADVVLEVEGLSTHDRLRDVSFQVRAGEVFGLGGVLGSGRTEVARALFGLDPKTAGTIRWKGRVFDAVTPKAAIAAGFALVPENRKFDGLFFNFTGFPNITSSRLDKLGPAWALSLSAERDAGRGLVRDLEITPAAETREVGKLSGGNQQKIVIARWLFAGADLFILDEPTQGIDISAKVAVYRLINRITAAGKSVILISSDHDEVMAMSDRIGIMSHGRLVRIGDTGSIGKLDFVRASAGPATLNAPETVTP
jgi:ABC-type sugar transport system ATPase subunit